MPENGSDISLQADTLAGDLRDRAFGLLRGWRKAPHELSESEQVGLARELEEWAREAVRQSVLLVGARRLPAVEVDLKQATVKARGVEIKVVLDRDDLEALEAAGMAGKRAVLVLVDMADYMGERAPVTIAPDEPELPLAADRTVAEIVRDQWDADDEADAAAAVVAGEADKPKRGKNKGAALS